MEEVFTYKVTLIAKVPAFDETDAQDIIEDLFGVGEEVGIEVTDCKYELVVK